MLQDSISVSNIALYFSRKEKTLSCRRMFSLNRETFAYLLLVYYNTNNAGVHVTHL